MEQSSFESRSVPSLRFLRYGIPAPDTRTYLHGETGQHVVPGPLAERLQLHVSSALVHLARPRPHGAGLELAGVVLYGLEVQRTRFDHVRVDLRDLMGTGGVVFRLVCIITHVYYVKSEYLP